MFDISFLIPAKNEESNIANCIDSINANCTTISSYEIVVGDHGSTDGTANVAVRSGARVISLNGGTIASLRNFLVENSTGSLIVFIDADVCLTSQWGAAITYATADLNKSPRQITGSRCSPPPIDNLIISNWFAVMPTRDSRYLGTGHIVFSRVAFEEIGGFDASLLTGEDYDFCARAIASGYAININSALKVIHYDYPLNVRDFVRREKWHGSGDFQSIKNILASRVALLALFFLSCHLLMVFLLPFSPLISAFVFVFVFVFIAVISCMKFPGLALNVRAKNIYLFYFYFVGRSLSFMSRLKSFVSGDEGRADRKTW